MPDLSYQSKNIIALNYLEDIRAKLNLLNEKVSLALNSPHQVPDTYSREKFSFFHRKLLETINTFPGVEQINNFYFTTATTGRFLHDFVRDISILSSILINAKRGRDSTSVPAFIIKEVGLYGDLLHAISIECFW